MKNVCLWGLGAMMALSALAKKTTNVTLHFTVKDKSFDSIFVGLSEKDTLLMPDASGQASLTLPLKSAQYGAIKYKWKSSAIYVEPKETVEATWTMAPSGLFLTFSGKNDAKNTFINGKELKGPIMKDFSLSEDDLLKQLEEYQAEDFSILESKKFDKVFTAKEKERITYWIYGMLWQYAAQKKCSDKVYDKLKSLMKEEEWLTQLSEYNYFMSGVISVLANQGQDATTLTPEKRVENEMEYAISHLQNKTIKDYILGTSAISYVSELGVDKAGKIKQLLEQNVTDKEVLNAFRAVYDKKKSISQGTPAYDFKLEDVNGKSYSLADFKGRYVYIDVWATWCAPCQEEMPALKELQEAFKGTNIAFVSVSIDKPGDKGKWKNQVISQKLGGVQLYAGTESQFYKDYQIQAIPRFILIGPKGEIINSDMTRPSDKRTAEYLANVAEGVEE